MDSIFMMIVTAISIVLGTIIFTSINKSMKVTYLSFKKIVTVWGVCVLAVFLAIFALSEKLGILDFVAK